jgi:DNA repair photolyase
MDRENNGEHSGAYKKGRGAQLNTRNRFHARESVREHPEGIDDWSDDDQPTVHMEQEAKSLVNRVDSPDVGMWYSMNPYQGCEHGCIYCYARNAHEYLGFSAGLDFERKIVVKINAPQLLRQFLMKPGWEAVPISLSGNTDCYQPAERKYRLTRALLAVCREFNQPVGIITKNAGVLQDKDILTDMGAKRLVSVLVTITTLQEDLRRSMEPRTTTAAQRLGVINELSKLGVRTGVMIGPVIPGLNDHEIQRILKAAADAGAAFSAYTFVRLNGAISILFRDWLIKNFPDKADKVWHLIQDGHGGQVNDSRFGLRMKGEGRMAEMVSQQFKKYSSLYKLGHGEWEHDRSLFSLPGRQMRLF